MSNARARLLLLICVPSVAMIRRLSIFLRRSWPQWISHAAKMFCAAGLGGRTAQLGTILIRLCRIQDGRKHIAAATRLYGVRRQRLRCTPGPILAEICTSNLTIGPKQGWFLVPRSEVGDAQLRIACRYLLRMIRGYCINGPKKIAPAHRMRREGGQSPRSRPFTPTAPLCMR